jgi:hypothetical protein
LNPKNVLPDTDASSYDPDEWNQVIVTKWLDWRDVSTLYSESDGELLRDRGEEWAHHLDQLDERDSFGSPSSGARWHATPDIDPEKSQDRPLRVIERQYKKLTKRKHFVDLKTGDTRPVPEDWDRERLAAMIEKYGGQIGVLEKKVKRIRWTVSCADLILSDEWSPYEHFTVVPYFPWFFHGHTPSLVGQLMSPQELLNKASSQELHVINTSANSGWIIEEDSLANLSVKELEAYGAKTGVVIEYKKGAQPPVKIAPNQVPTGLDRITFKAEEHLKTISNVSDSMQGFDREDVAAKAIALKQQRSNVNFTCFFDNLERSDWILARNVLALVQNYYTEPRLLSITHDDLRQESEVIAINQVDPDTGEITNDLTLGEYSIIISSTPYRASMEDSQFEQAVALRQLGVPLDDSVLIENSRLMRRKEIVDAMNAQKNSPEAQAQAELSQRGAAAEVGLKEAQAQKTMVDAQLNKARADRLVSGQEDLAKMAGTREKAIADERKSQMDAEKAAMEIQKMLAELKLKEQELEIKRREGEQRLAQESLNADRDHQLKQAAAAREERAVANEADERAANERLSLLASALNPEIEE